MATYEIVTLASIGAAQLLAVISPGPSFLMTARTAVARSRLDGVKVALGLGAGTMLWSCAALLGFNVLFHALPTLFVAMKVAGALFLLWIAWQIYAHAHTPLQMDDSGPVREHNPFLSGFLVQVSNPKVVVFFGSIFVAMLPANVPLWKTLALITIVTFNEVWWYSIVALFFGTGPIRSFYVSAKTIIDRFTGLFLCGLGIRMLWSALRDD